MDIQNNTLVSGITTIDTLRSKDGALRMEDFSYAG